MIKKTSTRVTDYIASEIRNGRLQRGDKLPSERELMEILSVGRSSVRESLNTFVDMDVLEKRMGIGVFVKKTDLNDMAGAYVISTLVDTKISRELLEFRLMLEMETVSRAAEVSSAADLQLIEQALALHVEAIEKNRSIIEADKLFHRAIVLAAKNSVLLKVYNSIADLLDSLKQDLLKVESKHSSLDYHREIYLAIKRGDGETAKLAMKEHLFDVTDRYEKLKGIKANVL